MSEPRFLVFRGKVEEFQGLDEASEHAAERAEIEETSYTVLRVEQNWRDQGLLVKYMGVVAYSLDEGEGRNPT